MKNVLVVSTSLRKNGNSEKLADAFVNGAKDAGHNVEKVDLIGREIKFCIGCLTCHKTQRCVFQDDSVEIVDMMEKADVIVFSTPIYYYEMAGQMKTLLDRSNRLYTADYNFRDIYLLATAAEDEESAIDGALKGMQGWGDCFEYATLKGSLLAGGVDIINSTPRKEFLDKAYQMGKSC